MEPLSPKINKPSLYLIWAQSLLFIGFLLLTFFFNRFAVDDYYFIGEINNKSFTEIYQQLYFKWHGRWSSNFLLLFFIQFYELPLFLFLYHVISKLLLFIGIKRIVTVFNTHFNLAFSASIEWLVTFTLLAVFFFSTVTPNETWFWFTSSAVYLWSVTAFVFSSRMLLITQPRVMDYVLGVLGLLYIGGANEPLTLFMLIGFAWMIIKGIKRKIVAVGAVIMGVSFLINYLSSGTMHRDTITPSLGSIDTFLYAGYGTSMYVLKGVSSNFLQMILVSLPFYLLGKFTKKSFRFHPVKDLVYGILIAALVIFLNHLIVVTALGSLAPDRSLISSSIVITVIWIRYLFLLGNCSKGKLHLIHYLPTLGCIMLLALLWHYSPIHRNYANAADKRIVIIKKSKEPIIKVAPLPTSGLLYNTEITPDANHFKNEHLKYGLGIENDVILDVTSQQTLN